ncbi:MAG: PKD domain-containing protein [Bacteroidetes bacterium]|nr:MAG: PKD domain-containing protein [Bacteroidota bacterium]
MLLGNQNKKAFYTIIGLLLMVMGVRAQAPQAQFSSNIVEGCAPLIVSYFDNSTNNPTGWSWDFGNGNNSSQQNPTTTYTVPGTYAVRLTASNASGSNTVTINAFITVYGKPTSNFLSPDTVGCTPHTANFTDLSTPGAGATSIVSWSWQFGDGNNSTLQNPTNVYTINGNRNVSLRVTNDKGCFETFGRAQYIRVGAGLDADFRDSIPAACVSPIPVFFTNTSTGNTVGSTFTWNFGDATPIITNNNTQVTHNYGSSSIYTVTLIGTNAAGCKDTATKQIVISAFNASLNGPDTICARSSAAYSFTTNGTPTSVQWTNGLGNTFTTPTFSSVYNTPGTYPIQLTLNYGSCTQVLNKNLVVKAVPTAGFRVASDSVSCQIPFLASFTNLSTGATSFNWTFGPTGATSTQTDPTYNYLLAGNYTVSLTARAANGCTNTITRTNLIRLQRPTVTLGGAAGTCDGTGYSFAYSTSAVDQIIRYRWDFGDPTRTDDTASYAVATTPPAYVYPGPGTYVITLVISTRTGCTATATRTITVAQRHDFTFTSNTPSNCVRKNITFTVSNVTNAQTPGTLTYFWQFGDGNTLTTTNQPSVTRSYAASGTYTVSVTVTSSTCSVTKQLVIQVTPPTARLGTGAGIADCSNSLTYNFRDNSLQANYVKWTFGNNLGNDTVRNPSFTFPASGVYPVRLVAYIDSLDPNQCADTLNTTVTVIQRGQTRLTATQDTTCRGTGYRINLNGAHPVASAIRLNNLRWNIGEGNTFTAANSFSRANVSYQTTGQKTAMFITTDIYNCIDTGMATIQVTGPTALFKGGNLQGCSPLQTTFTDTSFGTHPITNWRWNFGAGAGWQNFASNGGIQSASYPVDGTYRVSMALTDSRGCADSAVKTNYVLVGSASARFLSLDSLSCPGAPVRFVDSSTGNIIRRFWTITDASNNVVFTSLNVSNPVFSFSDTGFYSVKLVIEAASGCKDSLTKTNFITIKRPSAKFSISDSSTTCPPLQVLFIDSSYYVQRWNWDFRDGSISNQQNPVNVYIFPGTYFPKLTVTSPGGCTDTATAKIQIGGPTGNFTYTPSVGCAPLNAVTFRVRNSPLSVEFTWDFGDGTVLSTIDSTIVYDYLDGGDFNPRVLLKDAVGCVVPYPGSDTVHVEFARPLFTVDKTIVCDSGTVRFSDSTISNARSLSYRWSFGDGGTSTQKNPSHLYTTPGRYTVKLVVVTAGRGFNCSDSIELTNYITVVKSARPRIGLVDSVLCFPNNFTFTGLPQPGDSAVVAWQWYFGNGDSSALQNPVPQLFGTAGTFTNTLFTTDISGCRNSITRNVFLPHDDSLVVRFGGTPLVLCDSGTVQFSDSSKVSVPGIRTYNWTFGDGNTSTATQPSNFYASPGLYPVKLIITTDKGCIDSLVKADFVKVVKSPTAIINVSDSVLCSPATFTFSGAIQQPDTSAIFNWLWTFGNGNTSTLQNPVQQLFTVPGTFVNQLIAINSSGCRDTVTKLINVPFPNSVVAGFTVDRRVACDSATLSFTDTSRRNLPGLYTYSWNFGDNTPLDTNRNPRHFYAQPGVYTVKMVIRSAAGCADSVTKTDYIQIIQPKPVITLTDSIRCLPATFTFAGSVLPTDTFAITTWQWAFGNGATATGQNPAPQIFTTAGLFTNTLTVINNIGCRSTVSYQTKALSNDSLVVNFGATPRVLCDSGLVQFSDSSLINIPGTPTWRWNFGDGSAPNTSQNPSHNYTAEGSYTVSLHVQTNLPGCIDSLVVPAFIKVVRSPRVQIAVALNDSLCVPAQFNFSGTLAPDTSTITSWQWHFGNGNTSTAASPATELFSSVGSFNNTVQVVNSSGCIGKDTAATTVMPLPNFVLTSDTTICRGDTIQAAITGASTYFWVPSGSLSCTNCANPLAFPENNTTYQVTGATAFGCTEDTSFTVKVFQPYVLELAQGLDSVCIGQSTQLNASGAFIYNWVSSSGGGLSANNIPNPVATPTTTTVFTVTGTDSLNCFPQSRSVTVRVFPYPTITMPDTLFLSAGAIQVIPAVYSSDVVAYNWTPPTSLSCTNCPTPTITAFASTRHFVTVVNDGGCISSDTLVVQVGCDNSNTYIPNVFSPNGDGINDVFMVRGTGLFRVNSMRIFNRWGQMVFEKRNIQANNPSDGWNGRINSQKATSDAYVYVIEVICTNNQVFKYTGTVTLVN